MSDQPALLTEAEQRRFWLLAALPLSLALLAYAGQILSATLASRAPVALIAMIPTDPFLILTVNEMPAWAFFTVGFIRLTLPDPLLWKIGTEFGPAAKTYLDTELGRKSRITRFVSALDRWFPRVGPFFVFALPNYPVCLLAGITKMRFVPFALLNAAGTATRLYVIWRLGKVFAGPVERVLEFVTRYQLPFTVIMIGIVVMQMRSKKNGED